MTESDLRTLLNNLEASRASLHGWLHFWTFLVVVGVALEVISLVWEYLRELNDFKRREIHAPEKPSLLLFTIGFLGIALVVAGVSGELYIDVKAETIETGIRKANDDLLALISKEAGDAKTSAKEAADASTLAKAQAARAKEAADAASNLADSAAKNVALIESLISGRNIADPAALVERLRQFNGIPVIVESPVGDPEASSLCSGLLYVMQSAGMNASSECGAILVGGQVTNIWVSGPDDKVVLSVADDISRAGKLAAFSGPYGPVAKPAQLTVFVGHKAPFVIGQTWQTKAAEKLRKKTHTSKAKIKP